VASSFIVMWVDQDGARRQKTVVGKMRDAAGFAKEKAQEVGSPARVVNTRMSIDRRIMP
jgi:hypothetical protein